MNSQRTGLRVASIIFGIFAIGHLLRLLKQAPVTVGTMTGIPAERVAEVSCGASMVKTNVDFPSEAVRCQVRTLLESTDSLAERQ